jgi:hypothetical protein
MLIREDQRDSARRAAVNDKRRSLRYFRALADVVGVDHVCMGTDTKLTQPSPRHFGPGPGGPGPGERGRPASLGTPVITDPPSNLRIVE